MKKAHFQKGYIFSKEEQNIFLISKGKVKVMLGEHLAEILTEGDFFGEDSAIFQILSIFEFIAIENLEIFLIDGRLIKDIPIVRWKLIEREEKWKKTIKSLTFKNE